MKRSIIFVLFLIGTFFIALNAHLFAQSGSGRIQGTVRDASGAIIPGAKVTITATGTATSTNLVTNDAGIYATPALSIPPYRSVSFPSAIRRISSRSSPFAGVTSTAPSHQSLQQQ